MNPGVTKKNILLAGLPYLVFFIIAFAYFLFLTGYIFFYQEKSTLFVLSADYLNEHLAKPGSLLIYAGNFLTSFYYYPSIGAIIVSSVMTLVIFVSSEISHYLTGKEMKFIPFLIGGLLFYLHSGYLYYIHNSLGLLMQLVLFFLSIKYLRNWIPVLIFPVWYFLTGGFAWIFLVMFSSYLLIHRERTGWIKFALLWALTLLMIYFSKEYLFFQPVENLLTFPLTTLKSGSKPLIFLALIILIALFPGIAVLISKLKTSRISGLLLNTFLPLLVILISSYKVYSEYDVTLKHYYHVEKLFYQDKFDEIISYNLEYPSNNRLTSYFNNIALCESGKLNDLLFHFPQSLENNTLFLKWERVDEILKRGGYYYYTVGMINEAHRWFFEYMVMEGNTPQDLKMLIKTDLIYGNHQVAARYISILQRTIFYRKQAEEFEKLLFDDDAVDVHPELGKKRKSLVKKDFFISTDDPLTNLENILSDNEVNKNAFEYKLAFFLLNKDFMSIANELPNLEMNGFKKLPVHIEEAIVVRKALPAEGMDYSRFNISTDTEQRFNQYYQTFQKFGNDRKAAASVLNKSFGSTFWYYVMYY